MAGLSLCCAVDCEGPLRVLRDDAEGVAFEIHPDRPILMWATAPRPRLPGPASLPKRTGFHAIMPVSLSPPRSMASIALCCLPCICIARRSSIEGYNLDRTRVLTVTKVRVRRQTILGVF